MAEQTPAPLYAHVCGIPDKHGDQQQCEACAHDEALAVPRSDGEREREIRERLAKITRGPWKWGWRNDADAPGSVFAEPQTGHAYAVALCPRYEKRDQFAANAALIANAPDDLAWLLSLVDDLREQVGRAQALANTLEDALHPFGEFAVCYDAKPMLGRGDTIYAIHTGTPWESQLTFTDCRKAAKVLGYASAAAARETTP